MADPFDLTATCPATITFTGRISVEGGAGTVEFTWLRSDGATAPTETREFDGVTREQDVVTTWTLGAAGDVYEGWQAIQITAPRTPASNRASFTLTCL